MTQGLIADFDDLAAARHHEPGWLRTRRRVARDAFAERGLPGRRDENWRYTPIDGLRGQPLPPYAPAPIDDAVRAAVERARRAVGGAERLVFVDGHPAPELSDAESGCAALSASLAGAEALLGALSEEKDHPFEALNSALFTDGTCLRLQDDRARERVVHAIFVQTGRAPGASHLRNLVELAPGSHVTLVEHYVGLSDETPTLSTALSELHLAAGAELHHVRIQDEAARAFHVGAVLARVDADARLETSSLALGAGLARVDVRATLAGERAHAELLGLYAGRGRQHLDHHTTIDHAMPRTTSFELYKGILEDRAHGVFHGRIHVRPDAQQIDARQTNRTLLLSDHARINTKPQLEIYADDVRCSHGATVGSLDEEALFYLRSRGIGLERARSLLTLGFAKEITERVALPVLRYALATRISGLVEHPGAG